MKMKKEMSPPSRAYNLPPTQVNDEASDRVLEVEREYNVKRRRGAVPHVSSLVSFIRSTRTREAA